MAEKPAAIPENSSQDMNTVISDNLRSLRQSLHLSLSEVSERTGVSKSMLGQIERNESSPTISTLWKIATGLQVSFTSLMERPEQGISIVRESEVTPVINDHGRFRLYPVVPARPGRTFELVDLLQGRPVPHLPQPLRRRDPRRHDNKLRLQPDRQKGHLN